MSLAGKSLVSINDYSKAEWLQILKLASRFEQNPNQKILAGKVIACLFFEPSTRTRLSFETAVQRLGGTVIGFDDVNNTSGKKGESLKDTIRTVNRYADLIVIRHPLEGSARLASEYATIPVVNAGDGTNQHPTQTLLDLYSIQKTQGKLDNLTVAFGGDLRYNRTALTLIRALTSFSAKFILISPTQLQIPDNLRQLLQANNIVFEESTKLDAMKEADLIYVNRIKKEYFPDLLEYEAVKDKFILNLKLLEGTKPNFKVLHALPRVNEISEDIDSDPRAYYFDQARNGVYVRQALLASILGIKT